MRHSGAGVTHVELHADRSCRGWLEGAILLNAIPTAPWCCNGGMDLRHLGLPVRDSDRSLQFYATYFGFDPATATGYPDGTTIVRNADGFDLALHPVADPAPPVGFLHFGFRVADPDQVHALRGRMENDHVSIVERDDEPDFVSFKCLDPDGWRVEVYCEQH